MSAPEVEAHPEAGRTVHRFSRGSRWVHALTEGGALTMDATKTDAGAWTATGALPLAGSWQVTVDVRVDTFTALSGSCSLTVEP